MSNLCTFQFFKSFFEKKLSHCFWNCSYHHLTHVYQKLQSYMVRLLRYAKRKLSLCTILCLFTLLITRKIKTLKKWKTHLEMSPFYTCVPKIMIIWCMLPEIWKATNFFFIFWGHFLPFYPINDPEN